MKLSELKNLEVLSRPESNTKTIPEGSYEGAIATAEFVERESKYTPDGTRVVLNLRIEVEDTDGEIVDLYYGVNYSWSKKGKMLSLLEKLGCLPKQGGNLMLEDLVGIAVRVSVENVSKDDNTYSNITSIRRLEEHQKQSRTLVKTAQKPLTRKLEVPPVLENSDNAEDDLELDD